MTFEKLLGSIKDFGQSADTEEYPSNPDGWSNEEKARSAGRALEGKLCENCAKENSCPFAYRYGACEVYAPNLSNFLKIIRYGYPTMIANEILSDTPFPQPEDSIFYLKTVNEENE